jgi:hypothetical protein
LAYTDAETDSELTADTKWAAFNIHTIATGYNGGRTYCFRADQVASTAASVERCNDWLAQLKLASKLANQRVARQTLIEASKVSLHPLSLLGSLHLTGALLPQPESAESSGNTHHAASNTHT